MKTELWTGWLIAGLTGCAERAEPVSGLDGAAPGPDGTSGSADLAQASEDAAAPSDQLADAITEGGDAGDAAPEPDEPGAEPDDSPDAGAGPDAADAAEADLEPLRLAFTWHLEGGQLVSDRAAFDRYAAELRAFSELFAEYGAIPSWDAAEIVPKSLTYGVNILKELEDRGDTIGLHANGVGFVAGDPDYTYADMVTELTRQARQIRSLGLTVRHVSNICSAVDWVRATREAGLEAATAMVGYCLKSLSDPGAAADCANPSQCHDAWPGTVTGQMSAWHARSGSDWTTPAAPAEDTVLLIPTAGAVNCASEAASGTVSPTRCAYDAADADAVLAELEATIAARRPGQRHSFVMVASWGTRPDAAVYRALFSAIRSRWVERGVARWVGYGTLIDDLRAAPPLP